MRPLPVKPLFFCRECGASFAPKADACGEDFCSGLCKVRSQIRAKKKDRPDGETKPKAKPRKKVNHYIPRKDSSERACHDCGKKTADYRCPKCRDAWRAKHGVIMSETTIWSAWGE